MICATCARFNGTPLHTGVSYCWRWLLWIRPNTERDCWASREAAAREVLS